MLEFLKKVINMKRKKDLDLVAQDRHIITFVAIIIAIAHYWGTIVEDNIAVNVPRVTRQHLTNLFANCDIHS